ncbi:hypothetical protein DAI22_03g192200 [Oryza sativa Japonica Group]|nr:hypothetical protein DAI22_03g192200 [Oryza sativa Japonica Group]
MADRPPAMADRTATFVDLVIAIILPPLGVFLKVGCEIEFWICLLLTFLGYFPGIIYAVWSWSWGSNVCAGLLLQVVCSWRRE